MKHEVYQVNTGSVSLLHLLATAVSCSDYSVNMPPTLETTHGSCFFILCSFKDYEDKYFFRLEWGDEKVTFPENVLIKVNGKKNDITSMIR